MKIERKSRFASFLSGFARAFDLAGALRSYRVTVEKTDKEAIRRDFEAVGNDMRAAMGIVGNKKAKE